MKLEKGDSKTAFNASFSYLLTLIFLPLLQLASLLLLVKYDSLVNMFIGIFIFIVTDMLITLDLKKKVLVSKVSRNPKKATIYLVGFFLILLINLFNTPKVLYWGFKTEAVGIFLEKFYFWMLIVIACAKFTVHIIDIYKISMNSYSSILTVAMVLTMIYKLICEFGTVGSVDMLLNSVYVVSYTLAAYFLIAIFVRKKDSTVK